MEGLNPNDYPLSVGGMTIQQQKSSERMARERGSARTKVEEHLEASQHWWEPSVCLKHEADVLQVRAKPEIQHGLIQYIM